MDIESLSSADLSFQWQSKWTVYLVLCFILWVPATLGAILNEKIRKIIFFIVILLIPLLAYGFFQVDVLAQPWYRGVDRGFPVSIVDVLIFALFVSKFFRPVQKQFSASKTFFFWTSWLTFVIAFVLLFFRFPWIFGLNSICQKLKLILIFSVACHFLFDEKYRKLFLWAFALQFYFLVAFGLYQRYGLGVNRVSSFFKWPTDFAGYSSVFGAGFLACVFWPDKKSHTFIQTSYFGIAYICSLVSTLLTIGRTGVVCLIVNFMLVIVFVNKKVFSLRGLFLFIGIMVIFCGFLYKASDTFFSRLAAEQKGSFVEGEFGDSMKEGGPEGRQYYWLVAKEMIHKYPFGVGLNNWSWYNTQEFEYVNNAHYEPYESQFRAPNKLFEQAIFAHSTYLLYLCELGYLGLVLYVFMLLINVYYSFKVLLRSFFYRDKILLPDTMLLFGFSMCIVNFFEPIFVAPQCLYMYTFLTALGAVSFYRRRKC